MTTAPTIHVDTTTPDDAQFPMTFADTGGEPILVLPRNSLFSSINPRINAPTFSGRSS